MNNYGVEHYSKTNDFKIKCETTCLKIWKKHYVNLDLARKTV